jgi:hypothetical protein
VHWADFEGCVTFRVCPFFVKEQTVSRYDVEAFDTERYTVIVGWDNPLHTLFAQVWDLTRVDEEEESCVLWVGADPGSVASVEALAQAISAYAVLPADTAARLEREQAAAEPPTLLQQEVLLCLLRPVDPSSQV